MTKTATKKRKRPAQPLKAAFEDTLRDIAIADIAPLRRVTPLIKKSVKYRKIAATIREAGLVEPPVVTNDRTAKDKYLLLDGHLRVECLKDLGEPTVRCLVATDDEAFTYNKYVNRVATVQEHKMILKAIDSGVPADRLAKVLNVNVAYIRVQQNLLSGICPEAVELLKDKHVAINVFKRLKKMVPLRQIEAAELMVAMNRYTDSYAKSLLTATPESQRVGEQGSRRSGPSATERALLEREIENLDREFKLAEESYGADYLDLILAKGYLAKLLANRRVTSYFARHHPDYLSALAKIAEVELRTE